MKITWNWLIRAEDAVLNLTFGLTSSPSRCDTGQITDLVGGSQTPWFIIAESMLLVMYLCPPATYSDWQAQHLALLEAVFFNTKYPSSDIEQQIFRILAGVSVHPASQPKKNKNKTTLSAHQDKLKFLIGRSMLRYVLEVHCRTHSPVIMSNQKKKKLRWKSFILASMTDQFLQLTQVHLLVQASLFLT